MHNNNNAAKEEIDPRDRQIAELKQQLKLLHDILSSEEVRGMFIHAHIHGLIYRGPTCDPKKIDAIVGKGLDGVL